MSMQNITGLQTEGPTGEPLPCRNWHKHNIHENLTTTLTAVLAGIEQLESIHTEAEKTTRWQRTLNCEQ